MDIYYFLSLAVIAITILIMMFMRRPLSHKNKLPKIWYGQVNTSETSQHLFDMYSWTHISHGVLFYLLTWVLLGFQKHAKLSLYIFVAVLIEAIWEIVENSDYIVNKYRAQTISLGYFGDSIVNTIGDLICCMAGVLLGYYLPLWASIGYVIISEIVLAAVIKDNLFLNIIMLMYPIDTIKQWQSNA